MFNTAMIKGTAVAVALASAATLVTPDTADAHRRHYRGGNAAGAAFAGAAFGLVLGAVAASQQRRYYRDRYYYGYGPRYGYYGPRHYYGARHYYAPRHYYWR